MTTDAEIAPPSPPPATKKGPGRPRSTPETPQQRITRLQAELHQAQEAQKQTEQKQAAIVGAAVVRRARADENYRRELARSSAPKSKPRLISLLSPVCWLICRRHKGSHIRAASPYGTPLRFVPCERALPSRALSGYFHKEIVKSRVNEK